MEYRNTNSLEKRPRLFQLFRNPQPGRGLFRGNSIHLCNGRGTDSGLGAPDGVQVLLNGARNQPLVTAFLPGHIKTIPRIASAEDPQLAFSPHFFFFSFSSSSSSKQFTYISVVDFAQSFR